MSNLWTQRFDVSRMSDQQLATAIALPATPLPVPLHRRPVVEACTHLRRQLANVFCPSRQATRVVRQLVGVAHAHAQSHYPDVKTYRSGIFAKTCPLQPTSTMFLTGLAGVGKSSMMRAVERLLRREREVAAEVGSGLEPVQLRTVWSAMACTRFDLRSLLSAMVDDHVGVLEGARSHDELCSRSSRLAYRLGVSLMIADELQFTSLSAKANAQVTKLMYSLRYVGVPVVVVGNYSLAHRLMKRPAEDRHRLLASPIVLLPDDPDDDHLPRLYAEYETASGGAIRATDHLRDVVESLSLGIHRFRCDLLVRAYALAREARRHRVEPEDVRAAFALPVCQIIRLERDQLIRQEHSGRLVSRDIWCPFELPQSQTAGLAHRLRDAREEEMARQACMHSLTSKERAEYARRRSQARRAGDVPLDDGPCIDSLGGGPRPDGDDVSERSATRKRTRTSSHRGKVRSLP